MASELDARFPLVATLRAILAVLSVFGLLNAHTYIGRERYASPLVQGAFAAAWALVAWNLYSVLVATIHPQLQRFAAKLPFPVAVNVRDRSIISYGDGDADPADDGCLGAIGSKVVAGLVDAVLATVLGALTVLCLDEAVECWTCVEGYQYVDGWMLNIWFTMVGFQYAIALVLAVEAVAVWFTKRHLSRRGQISLA